MGNMENKNSQNEEGRNQEAGLNQLLDEILPNPYFRRGIGLTVEGRTELSLLSGPEIRDLLDRDLNTDLGGPQLTRKEQQLAQMLREDPTAWQTTLDRVAEDPRVNLKTEVDFTHIRRGFLHQLGTNIGGGINCHLDITAPVLSESDSRHTFHSFPVIHNGAYKIEAQVNDGRLVISFDAQPEGKTLAESRDDYVHLIVACTDESALYGLRNVHEGKYQIIAQQRASKPAGNFAISLDLEPLRTRACSSPFIYIFCSEPFPIRL